MTEQSFSTSADVLVKLHCCLTQNTIKRCPPPSKKSIEKAINWQKQDVDSFCSLKMGHSEQLSTVKPQKSHQRLNHCNSVWNRPQLRENAQFAEDSLNPQFIVYSCLSHDIWNMATGVLCFCFVFSGLHTAGLTACVHDTVGWMLNEYSSSVVSCLPTAPAWLRCSHWECYVIFRCSWGSSEV